MNGVRLLDAGSRWVRVAATAYVCVFAVLSLLPNTDPWVFPDSASYLRLSFLGNAPRLWTVPFVYTLAVSDESRILVQTAVGAAAWLVLAAEAGRHVRHEVVRRLLQLWLLAISLSGPVLQWNRAILSESLSISITVLLVATALRLWRRPVLRSLGVFLVVLVLWIFARQPQAYVAPLIALGFVAVAVFRRDRRKGAAVGAGLCVMAGAWGWVTAGRPGPLSVAPVNVAGIVQFRAVTNSGEMAYLSTKGMPRAPSLRSAPPLTHRGLPVNVGQIGDGYAVPALLADPAFNRWAGSKGQGAIVSFLIRHPDNGLWPPLTAAPSLLTMDPGYVPMSAASTWIARLAYGTLRANPSATTGDGARSSSDPIYLEVLAVIALGLTVAAGLSRGTDAAPVLVWALAGLAGAWVVVVWAGSAVELPRLLVAPAVLVHIALVLISALGVDALLPAGARPASILNGPGRAQIGPG